MKIWRFENFLEIVNTGNINAAAEKLHISPQALHQQMDTLEGEVGCKLLVRSRKGIALTAAGKVFYRKIGAIVGAYKKLIEETNAEAQKEKNTVTVMSSALFKDFLIIDALSSFKEIHPEIMPVVTAAVQIGPDSCDNAVNDLVYPKEYYEVYSSVLSECFIHAPDTHRLSACQKVSVQDLFGETLMVVNEELLDQLSLPVWNRIKNYRNNIRIENIPSDNAGDFMVCSKGNLLLSWGPSEKLHPRVRQIRLEDSVFEYKMLYHKKRFQESEALRTMLEFIEGYYRENWQKKYDRIIQTGP